MNSWINWIDICWYRYLFQSPWTWRRVLCRIGGHRAGVVYYNAGGSEPDMHCKNCGEDLG
jgi:hypothetical protein